MKINGILIFCDRRSEGSGLEPCTKKQNLLLKQIKALSGC